MLSRHYGRFKLCRRVIEDNTLDLLDLFGNCIILKAEMNYIWDYMEYDAWSVKFRELDEGEIVPSYIWEFDEGVWSCNECNQD